MKKQEQTALNVEEFAQQIQAMRDRIAVLEKLPTIATSSQQQAIEELHAALEELQVAHEELRRQNQELAAARAAAELERQRYEELFEFAPDAYLATDATGTIQHANRAAARLLGYSQASLIGKRLIVFVATENRRAFRSELLGFHLSDGVREWKTRLCRRNGEAFDAAGGVAAVRDAQGHVTAWGWLLRDITERSRAAEALRLSEARHRAITEMTSDYLYSVSIAPNGQRVSEWASGCLQRLSGYHLEELSQVGGWVGLIHPEDRAIATEFARRVCANQPGTVEYRIFRKDGEVRWVRDRAQPEWDEEQQRVARVLGAVEDITEHKRSHEQLDALLSLLQGTLEATGDGIIVSQHAKDIAIYNQKFLEMWGIPESVIASRELNKTLAFILERLKEPQEFLNQAKDLFAQPEAEGYSIFELKDGRIFERYSQPQRQGGQIVGRVCSFREITDRLRAEAALKESEARYRAIVEDQTELICRFKPDGTLTFVNDAYCRYFSKQREALIGNVFVPMIVEEDLPKVEAYVASLSTENPLGTIEHRVILPSGEIRWQQWSDRAIFDEGGEVVEIQSVGQDITDRKRAEEALREKEKFLRLILDNIPLYICWKDRNSVYLGGNLNNARLAGFDSPEELVGKTDFDLPWTKEEAELFRECDRRVMEADAPEYHIIEAIHKADGKRAWLDTSKIPLHDARGNVIGILAAIEDITARVEAEQALHKSEATNRALLNAIPDLIMRMSRDGIYLDVRPAKNFNLLMPVSEMVGKTLYDVLPFHLAQQRMQYIQQAWETGENQIYEYDLVIDGTLYYEEARIVLSGEDEALVIARDITDRKQIEKALKKSEERYRRIIETTLEGVWILDAKNHTVFANNRMAEMLGYTLEELLGKPVHAFADRQYLEMGKAYIECFRSGGGATHADFKLRRKDGSELWVLVAATPIFDEAGQYEGVLAMLTDITDRKAAEEALRRAEAKYRGIFENVVEGLFQTTVEGRFLTANPMLARIYGCDSPEELIATIGDIQHQLYVDPNRRAEFMRLIEEYGAVWGFESQMYRKDARIIWISENAHALYDAEGRIVGYEGTVEDITERKFAEDTIEYQAFHDLLTGLPNRMLFNDRLEALLSHASAAQNPSAVMFLDLDRFKTINDTLGHAIGDRLLQSFAHRIAHSARDGDTVARWGGDEFTVLLPEISSAENAAKIAQRILDALKQPFYIESHELYVSTSIGIALYPQDGENGDTLLRNADAALYRAKERGRNNYQFYLPAMNSGASELLTLENRLHQALEGGEFVVYYQPQVNLNSGKITGMEALVRWQHPEWGLVSPAKFIPLAEETGLIAPIGEWVLRTACAQNKIWQDAGFSPLRVAVNLSGRQFQNPNLVAVVAQILQETGLAPHLLELEITESSIMQNTEMSLAMMRELREMGVHISMDDFGTGYSSLSYLKKFPLHTLKIDRSFVRDLKEHPPDAAIVAAVIKLAGCLNLRVVAEGVETKEQMELLRRLQCEEMQGYLFSPPLSDRDSTNLLENYWAIGTLIALQENKERFKRYLLAG